MNEFETQVASFAEQAVATSQANGYGDMDYSEASLAVVEKILEDTSAYAAQMTPDQIAEIITAFGSYILEVGRRQFGGHYSWYDPADQPVLVVGEPAWRIALMTLARVESRLQGKLEDNIPFFFEGFSSRVRNAQPGDDAFYV